MMTPLWGQAHQHRKQGEGMEAARVGVSINTDLSLEVARLDTGKWKKERTCDTCPYVIHVTSICEKHSDIPNTLV